MNCVTFEKRQLQGRERLTDQTAVRHALIVIGVHEDGIRRWEGQFEAAVRI